MRQYVNPVHLVTTRDGKCPEGFVEVEIYPPRPDASAIHAAPELADKNAVVLYFATPQDRDDLVALIREVKPGMRAVNIR